MNESEEKIIKIDSYYSPVFHLTFDLAKICHDCGRKENIRGYGKELLYGVTKTKHLLKLCLHYGTEDVIVDINDYILNQPNQKVIDIWKKIY